MNNKCLGFLLLGVGVLPFVTSLPVHAAWEYTRWGMTVADVKAASQGQAVPVPPGIATPSTGTQQTLLKSQWQFDRYAFDVFFNFSGAEPRLTEVLLTSNDDANGMGQAFILKHGLPSRTQGGLTQTRPGSPFSLVEQGNFAVPGGEVRLQRPASAKTQVSIEWETPINFIQFQRQGSQGSISYRPVDPQTADLEQSITYLAETFIDFMIARDFVQARERLHPVLQAEWTPEVLEQKLNQFQQRVGPFRRRVRSRVVSNVVLVTTEFTQVTDDLTFVFSDNKKIVAIDFPQQDTDLLPD